MIPKETIDNITKLANIVDTITDFSTLHPVGKDFLLECPSCGKFSVKGKKGMIISPAKNIGKCFSCEAGVNPISYLMDYQNFDYPKALKYLAEKLNIVINEEAEPRGPQKKENKNILTFRDKQLQLSGLTDKDQKVSCKDGDKTIEKDAFESATIDPYGRIVPGDDMIIYYYDLDGKPVTFQKKENGKFENLFRIRWQNPDLHPDKEGRPVKYKSPYGSGSHLYIPDAIRRKYADKRVIRRLFIQEGEKKAEKACKHGFDSVGIMGIQNIARDGKLPYEFQLLIQACQIKEVIFLLDSDWDELSHNLKPETRVDQRPANFFYAVKNFRDYFKTFANIGIYIETYFAYINKNDKNDKGIDDLLTNTLNEKEIDLIRDFDQAINNIKETDGKGKYISIVKVSTTPDLKLQEYWNLHSAEAFAEHYKDELMNLPVFKIKKYLWRFNENGKLELAQPLLEDEMFFERITKHDRAGNEHYEYRFRWLYAYNFLKRRGYGRLMMASGQFMFCLVENKIVKPVDTYMIKDFMLDLAKEIAPKQDRVDVMDMLYRGGKMYFGPDSLSNIDFCQPRFDLSGADFQYMFFSNKYLRISADEIKEDLIDNLNTYVWSEKIRSHEFKLYTDPLFSVEYISEKTIKQLPDKMREEFSNYIGMYSIDVTEEAMRSDFMQYLIKTSDFTWRNRYDNERKLISNSEEKTSNLMENNLQLISKLTAIGYLIHNYFDAANSKAVIAMDGKNSEVGESHGGSGKSLFGDAICKMVNTVVVNGKNKKLTDDPFWAEEVTEKTDVVFIDDVRANIDFEFFFPCITGKFVVNPKNGKKFTIPRENTPKIFIPTNHAVNGEGSSFRRRQSFVVFSDFYGDKYSPLDDFGKRMFDEWDYDQWNLFYNIAALCIQLYLKFGLVQPPSDKIDVRRLRQSIGENFLIWCDEFFGETEEERFKRKELFAIYIDKNPHERKYTTPHIFKKKVKNWCIYRGHEYNPHRDGQDEKSNGIEYFTIVRKKQE